MSEGYPNSADLLLRCKETIELLRSEIESAKHSKKDSERKLKMLEDQIIDLKNDLEKQQVLNDNLQVQVSRHLVIVNDNALLIKEINEYKKEISALNQENTALRSETEKLLKEKQENSDQLNRKSEELSLLKSDFQLSAQLAEGLKISNKDLLSKIESFQQIINSQQSENENLKASFSKKGQESRSKNEDFEILKKKMTEQIKSTVKLKYKEKEKKLKSEIDNTIGEIQQTIKNSSIEQARIKKENIELQKTLYSFQHKSDENTKEGLDLEGLLKSNDFFKEKLEITENSLKQELTKNVILQNEIALLINETNRLSKKLSRKSSSLKAITQQLSEIEQKSESVFNEFLEKEAGYREKIARIQEAFSEASARLKKSSNDLQLRESEIQELKSSLKLTQKSLDQVSSDKKSLESIINDLEVSIKHLNIQQTRQSLEELAKLKQKLAEKTISNKELKSKTSELQQECEYIQKKIIQDSHFFKIENARKDQEILKLSNYFDSKIKQNEAKNAIKLEEIKADLTGVLEDLINNEVALECCAQLEEIIESLS